MKYHALFVIFGKAAKFRLLFAANYSWRCKGNYDLISESLSKLFHLSIYLDLIRISKILTWDRILSYPGRQLTSSCEIAS